MSTKKTSIEKAKNKLSTNKTLRLLSSAELVVFLIERDHSKVFLLLDERDGTWRELEDLKEQCK